MGLYTEALKKLNHSKNAMNVANGPSRPFGDTFALSQGHQNAKMNLPRIPKAILPDIMKLQERMDYLLPNRPSRVLGICGITGQEGCSTIAYLLSLFYAQMGYPFAQQKRGNGFDRHPQRSRQTYPLLLLDANLHSPNLHHFFAMQQENGLVEIVEKNLPLQQATTWVQPQEFAIITAGKPARSATHIFKSLRMQQLLRQVRESFYTIMIDFSAILQHPDLLTLGDLLDGVVLVTRGESTTLEDLRRAQNLLEQNRVKILGVVVNRFRKGAPVSF